MIIDITYYEYSENVVEVMFHVLNDDWFIALFPAVDVDRSAMRDYYYGRDFYTTKNQYEDRIFV